jgi:hypothetical protein
VLNTRKTVFTRGGLAEKGDVERVLIEEKSKE